MSTTKKTLRLYWQHALQYRRQLTLILACMPLLQLADDFVVPYLTSRIMNRIAVATGPLNLGDFLVPIAVILAVELCVNVFWRPYIKNFWRFEENVMRDLYQTSFDHLMQMSYRFYSNRFAGSLVSQVNKFAGSFERLSDVLVWNVYKLLIAFIFTVIILAKPAPLYVLVLTVFTTLYVIVLVRLKKTEQPFNKRWAKVESERTGQLADSISNVLAVKSFGNENLEAKLFGKETDNVRNHSIATMHKVMYNEAFTTTSQRAINAGAILSSIYLASRLAIPVGTVYLVLIYTLGITRRLWDLNSTLRNLNRVFGDAADLTEILDISPEVADKPDAPDLAATRGDIAFKGVEFTYPESKKPLFKNFDLHIKPGEKVGLVGHSGSGKTTLTKLVLRFTDIQKGQILIDGHDIADVTQNSLRRSIAYVPQEPLMFHRSIADNIRYGQLDAPEEQVETVAKMAHAHDFITGLPKGYNTMVGERGTKLSGGQRQRVAIARAMIKNSPILLLDEATSALDSESEQLIQDALWKLMEGRTAIVIAHRLSTIQKMDRILVMEDGQIVEQGTHRELLRQKGTYASLWTHQSGGFLED